MRLLLIRHGQTPSNVQHLLDTAAPGADLNELGRTQAAAVPAALAGEVVGAIYASNLVRTQQTAQPLADALGLPVLVRDGLREVAAGDLEMRGDNEALHAYLDVIFSWPLDPARRMPGGEDGREVLARFDEVVAEAFASGVPTVAMFSHGAVIRVYAAARARGIDADFALHHWLRNTGMVALEGDPASGWELVEWCEAPLGGAELDGDRVLDPTGAPESALPD